jgi:hypothetical protein
VENPLAVSRGVASVELDGATQSDNSVPLTDDGQTHIVRVVLGEKITRDLPADSAGETTQEEQIK